MDSKDGVNTRNLPTVNTRSPLESVRNGDMLDNFATLVAERMLTMSRPKNTAPKPRLTLPEGDPWPFEVTAKTATTIGKVWLEYEAEFSHRRKTTVFANNEAVRSFLLTVQLHDGCYIGQITRDVAQEFRRALIDNTAIKRIGGRPLNAVTMAKRLGIVKAFTKWCHANDYLDTDPFSGLQINAHKVNASKLRKEAWTVKEIGTMLEAVWPLRNCPDPREQEWCWYLLSLIGSGCRASEILNRDVADVKQDGESWLWDINTAEDKPVKNVFSIRKIPIPKALLAVGYMEYAKAQKPSGKLFPRLCQAGSMMISFKFARLTKSLNLYTKTKTLHSIRAYHAVSMELAGVHPSLARSIAGHQVAADVHGVYLNSLKFPMERMQQAVDTVPIPLPKEEI